MRKLWQVVRELKKPSFVYFGIVGTGENYKHDQSEFEIQIPSVGSRIRCTFDYDYNRGCQGEYIVQSVTWDRDEVTVLLKEEIQGWNHYWV